MRGAQNINEWMPRIEEHLGNPIEKILEKRQALDPVSFADPLLDHNFFPRVQRKGIDKRTLIALQLEMMDQEMQKPGAANIRLDEHTRKLFASQGMLIKQVVARTCAEQVKLGMITEAEAKRVVETTTDNDVATVAAQVFPIVMRAMASNPILDLVGSFQADGPSGNVIYFDVLYATAGGAYATGTRVDNNDDPNYSDRDDCEAVVAKLNMTLDREIWTVADKALGGDICLPAMQDATNQFTFDLKARLAEKIDQVMNREWARQVADSVRTMAGNVLTWSTTVPGPYSSLNTNEWRKTLFEVMVRGDNMVVQDIYEQTEWVLMRPAISQILERVCRFKASPNPVQAQAGSIATVTGEFGDLQDRWSYWKDPFFADNTILGGRRSSNLVDNDFYYFIPYIMGDAIRELFDPDNMVLKLGGLSRAAMKAIEMNAFFRIDISGTGEAALP